VFLVLSKLKYINFKFKLEQNIKKYDRFRKKMQLEVTIDVLCVFL